jgi:ABC-type oligopeptide transport system ATPase subunit
MNESFTIENLSKFYGRGLQKKYAISGLSLKFPPETSIGIVGESGSGKSTLARCLVGLSRPNSGKIYYRGKNIAELKGKDFQKFRREVQMVFQDPYSSLNPRMRIREIVSEGIQVFKLAENKEELFSKTKLALNQVGISDDMFERYPRQFSGGQRQRISIARALAVSPRMLICDEPVSSLDVSIQAQILNLLRECAQKLSLNMVFISHDLGVIRYISNFIIVMQSGQIVEADIAEKIFENPQSEYTKNLLLSVPLPDPKLQRQRFSLDL